jgi:hypothetical protein
MDYHISTTWAGILVFLAIWELAWKGFGLWRAAQNQQTGWFVALLVINTAGLLPIIYLTTSKKGLSCVIPAKNTKESKGDKISREDIKRVRHETTFRITESSG